MFCIRAYGKLLSKWSWLIMNRKISARSGKGSVNNPFNTVTSSIAGDAVAEEKKIPITAQSKEEAVMQVARKKKQKQSFAKELFLGRVDKEMLYFPEILEPKQLGTLQHIASSVQDIFRKVDSAKIDKEAKITDDVLLELKNLGLFGQQVPTEYEGMDLKATECARLAEVTGWDTSISTTLIAHNDLGLKGILLHGSDAQKARYLPKLATGEWLAAFCLSEANSGSDIGAIQTEATLSDDGKFYTLNGSKVWICNGGTAEVFIVFAKNFTPDFKETLSAFIVERSFGGITHSNVADKLGIRGCNVCSLVFNNTPVPVENILGKAGEGVHIAASVLNSSHFIIGSSCAGLLKNLFNTTMEHAINCTRFEKSLSSYELIQKKFAQIACKIYAVESMTYFTAGIIDQDDQMDHSVESAIVKVFSSEAAWYCVNECLQILGTLGCLTGSQAERALRDVRVAALFGGPNEIVRMFIALSGCQHAGKELVDTVRKMRNPLFHPGFIVKKVWQNSRQRSDNPKLNLDLAGYLHPSFLDGASSLEYALLRFQYCVEQALAKHGKEIINKQIVLDGLANIAINVYAMTASLSRASRSYCIGLPNTICERLIALTFCKNAVSEIKANVQDIINGPYFNNDANYHHIATTLFKNRGYGVEHALSRSFN